MQYIQFQPQLGTDIPSAGDGYVNFYIDTQDNSIKIKTDSGTTVTTGGGGVTDVTYSELRQKITGSTLVAGSFYKITDFKTCYDQPDYDYNKNAITTGIYRDDTEVQPIIVFATSSNTISDVAYQPSYPNDKIKYDWTFDSTERTGNPAYGRISERIDEFNNRTDYDHRQIKFKRYRYYEYQLNNPYNGTIQVSVVSGLTMSVSGTGTNFNSIGVGNRVGFDDSDYKIYEITDIVSDTEMTVTGLTTISVSAGNQMYPTDWDEYSSYYQNNVQGGSQFEEYYTFDGTDNYNNYIGNHANLYNWEENDFILANNVFWTRFKNNKFGDGCYNNTFFDDCENNHIGNFFYNNITDDDFDGNVIGNYFYNNKITSKFQYNRIGEYFRNNYIVQNDFYRNNIMNGFEYNEISGGDFQNNEIGSGFNNNKIKEEFYKNDIGNGFNNNKIYWGANGNLIGNAFNYNNIYCAFYDNVIGEYFADNTLGDILNPSSNEFYENRIGIRFQNNTITNNFYKNDIGPRFYDNSISGNTYTNRIGEQFENNTIYQNFYDNQIFNEFKGNVMYGEFYENKTDWGFAANQFSGYCAGNSFGSFFTNNDFLGDVYGNVIKDGFGFNTIGNGFNGNNIGSAFNGNTIAQDFRLNEIGSFFQNNIIDEGFGFGGSNSQKNYIGDNFQNNNIGEYFYNNRVGINFTYNTVGDYFQWNVIDTDIISADFTTYYGNITAFTYTASGTTAVDNTYVALTGTTNGIGVEATFNIEVSGNTVVGVSGNTDGILYSLNNTITILGSQIGGTNIDDDIVITVTGISPKPSVYETYTCSIFERQGGNKRLSFYDNSDILTIKNINE